MYMYGNDHPVRTQGQSTFEKFNKDKYITLDYIYVHNINHRSIFYYK